MLFNSNFGFGFTKIHLRGPKIIQSKYRFKIKLTIHGISK
jgi:hypothetical protein